MYQVRVKETSKYDKTKWLSGRDRQTADKGKEAYFKSYKCSQDDQIVSSRILSFADKMLDRDRQTKEMRKTEN